MRKTWPPLALRLCPALALFCSRSIPLWLCSRPTCRTRREREEKKEKNTNDIYLLKKELERIKLEKEEMKQIINSKNKYIL